MNTAAFDHLEASVLLRTPFSDMGKRHGVITHGDIYVLADRDAWGLNLKLAGWWGVGSPTATLEFDAQFWEDLTEQGWRSRFRLIDKMFEQAAARMRGEVIVKLLAEPWSLNYVDDDALQKLEHAALKTMQFVDDRRKKFVL